MESALTSIIMAILMLFTVLTLGQTYLEGQDTVMLAEQTMQTRVLERAKTDLAVIGAQTKSAGSVIEITLKNTGSLKLADFDRWDVLVQYYASAGTYRMAWLPYTAQTLNDNQWTVVGIYVDAAFLAAEVYDPDILDPGEEMILRVKVAPSVGLTTTNMVTIGAGNGTNVSTQFTR